MSVGVKDIVDAVSGTVAEVLGPAFSPLQYTLNVEDNTFRGANSRYGVAPRAANQSDESTTSLFVDQDFQITLTDGYITTAGRGDAPAINQAATLQTIMQTIYTELVRVKAGLPSHVLRVSDLRISDPSYDDQNKLVVVTATITIKYRNSL